MSKKGSGVTRRRQEDSVAALSLVPIETYLKSVLIAKWQEGNAAGDSSLVPRAWPQAERHAVGVWFAHLCAQSCVLSGGHSQASGRENPPDNLVLDVDPT